MKLIPLDAVLAEIESLLDKGKYHEEYDCAYRDGNNGALYALKGRINSLEVKEVDFEEFFNDEYSKFSNDTDAGDYAFPIDLADFKDFAKHFFERGIKAQKGEL